MRESQIQMFENEQFGSVRVVMSESGEPMFVAKDVAKVLGYEKPQNAVLTHCKQGDALNWGTAYIPHQNGIGGTKAIIIGESNLYRLIMRSQLPDAEKFQDWVCDEVLPSIRKHGAYMTDETLEKAILSPDFLIRLAINLKEEQTKRIAAEKQVSILKPKAELMEKVLDCDEKIDIGQAAKILNLPFGRNTLFQKLREMGVFFKNKNEPKQIYISRKYFELREKYIERNSHDGFAVIKVLVTQRGLEFLSSLFDAEPNQVSTAKIV